MRDEDLAYFIQKFGENDLHITVRTDSVVQWKNRLPTQLLQYWSDEGWSRYSSGLIWIVNPGEYEGLKNAWLQNTQLENADEFHVIARSAFGKLFLWGKRTGPSVTISPYTHSIACLTSALKRTLKDPDDRIKSFFSGMRPQACDLKDENGRPMFSDALHKLGPLAANEIYGFEPALILGGRMRLENLVKIDMFVHLDILRSLADPSVPLFDINISKYI